MLYELSHNRELVELLTSGGVAVMRTDTLYGVVARADDERAVERVFAAKGRDADKSCIVLLADFDDAFGSAKGLRSALQSQQPTSVLVESIGAPVWLLRQNNEIAYRIPADSGLRDFLRLTGPLIAPSANLQGQPPARTINQARAYFGDAVDMYVDGGEVPADMAPSRIVRIRPDGSQERLR